jgi:hypothetical protein
VIGETETHTFLLIAFTGHQQLLQSVLKKEPKLKATLETIDSWSIRWVYQKRGEYTIPKSYFLGFGYYLCLMLPNDSMFFIKLKLLENLSEERYNLLEHLRA